MKYLGVLVLSIFIVSIVAEVCEDGTDCKNALCCKSWFHYRCCSIEDGGVCCSGGYQCCPSGYECLRLGINNFCVNGTSITRPSMHSAQTIEIIPALFTEDVAEISD
ncbi:unnamed protein product [Larinioides sclopetarius]|uniref:Granulins domain-containing protein n=1 Tax=Larinioides sclopetarius TaxID=280406 RepID=A0AAV2AYM1_9ARAC